MLTAVVNQVSVLTCSTSCLSCRSCAVTKDTFPAPCTRFAARSAAAMLQFWSSGGLPKDLKDYPQFTTAADLADHLGKINSL
jgi:hypothetical protein